MTHKIEWLNPPGYVGESWNFATGCSMGCDYCYAAKIAKRFWGDRPFNDVQVHWDRIEQPYTWKKPRCVFVNSMGDWADHQMPKQALDKAFEVMKNCPGHIFILLTKRPDIANQYLASHGRLPNHIWLGTSVENQVAWAGRIKEIRKMKSYTAANWISYEPATGEINPNTFGGLGLHGIDWMVMGGMSGQNSAKFELQWLSSMAVACNDSEVPLFVKQLGANPWYYTASMGNHALNLKDKKGGDMSEWPTWAKLREYPLILDRLTPAPWSERIDRTKEPK